MFYLTPTAKQYSRWSPGKIHLPNFFLIFFHLLSIPRQTTFPDGSRGSENFTQKKRGYFRTPFGFSFGVVTPLQFRIYFRLLKFQGYYQGRVLLV